MKAFYILCFLELSNIKIAYGDLTNIALGKEASQSSTRFDANNAVDGKITQYKYLTCTHTQVDVQPFWEVDLEDTYIIANIKVYNRLDCCSERLSDVSVDVSTDHVTYTQFGYHAGAIGSTHVFYPLVPVVVGRWVKIALAAEEALTVCEVQVMSNMTHRYDYLKKVDGARGTGNVLSTKTVVSLSQCVFLCKLTDNCHSVNFRQELTSSQTEMECQFLDNVTHEPSSDPNITFCTMATVI